MQAERRYKFGEFHALRQPKQNEEGSGEFPVRRLVESGRVAASDWQRGEPSKAQGPQPQNGVWQVVWQVVAPAQGSARDRANFLERRVAWRPSPVPREEEGPLAERVERLQRTRQSQRQKESSLEKGTHSTDAV